MTEPWAGKLPDYIEASVLCSFPGCTAEFRRLLTDKGQSDKEVLDCITALAKAYGWQVEPDAPDPEQAWDYCPDHHIVIESLALAGVEAPRG